LETGLISKSTLGKRILASAACLFFVLILGALVPDTFANERDSSPARASRAGLLTLNAVSSSKPLKSGIEIYSGPALVQILALRDDVLRIRIAATGRLPEDASWAVLTEPRTQQVDVTPDDSATSVGFRTTALRIQVERASFRMCITDANGNILQQDAAGLPVEFRDDAFRIYKEMPLDEHYFGLGDKPGPLDRRNQAFTLWNTDAFQYQESTDPLYKSIPFFLTARAGRSAGILLDNTWRTSFDFGKKYDGIYSFGAEDGPIDYYFLSGPDAKHVLASYTWLTGLAPMPPKWALGFQQSRYSYDSEQLLRAVADRMRADRIPGDALYLDIDFQQSNRPFTVDTQKFPHFEQMIGDLRKQHFHVVAITDLHIAQVPNASYRPYDEGIAADEFVKNPDGSIYVGTVWPGPSVFPDFTRASVRDWWGTLYKPFVADGIAGFWNDMNEPSIFNTPTKTMPASVQHRIDEPGFRPRVATHLEIHDVYGMENSRATYEGLLKIAPNQRPFVLTRASYAGGQRFAATWTGDNSSTWNHLRLTTPMLLNLGLSGFALSGADVGGFDGTPPPDLFTRWIELATFQPIDRDHSNKGSGTKEVWVNGPEHEAIRRRYIEERYRLMPYLYTAADEMSRTGIPIVRPLFLEFANATSDGHPLDLDAGNEFMFGPALLVAPAAYPEQIESYDVILPLGIWYDYWSGQRITTSQPRDLAASLATTGVSSRSGEPIERIRIQPRLDVLPAYVRGGSIVPIQPLTQSTDETPVGSLTVRVYPGPNCGGSIYEDDGSTMAYKNGDFLRTQFSCQMREDLVQIHVDQRQGTYKPWWKDLVIEVYGWSSSSASLVLNGKPDSRVVTVDPQKHTSSVTIPDSGAPIDIEIRTQH
jgi:alpha-glucosidase